jgi:hypothetical protein
VSRTVEQFASLCPVIPVPESASCTERIPDWTRHDQRVSRYRSLRPQLFSLAPPAQQLTVEIPGCPEVLDFGQCMLQFRFHHDQSLFDGRYLWNPALTTLQLRHLASQSCDVGSGRRGTGDDGCGDQILRYSHPSRDKEDDRPYQETSR